MQKRQGYLLAAVMLFALVGIVLLGSSNAATYVVPLEAENGTLAGNQGSGATNGASNNASVLFGSTNTGGGGGNTGSLTHTWLSGMGRGDGGYTNAEFASWRGGSQPTIAGTWNDSGLDVSIEQYGVTVFGSRGMAIDNAVGGIYRSSGETYAKMASGALDSRFRTMLQNINKNWGSTTVMFLRFAHEFNGNWYSEWNVKPSDTEDFKKAQQRFYQLVQEELVAKGRNAKVAYAPNSDSHNGVNVTQSWPGDQYIDVVAVDSYDGNGLPYITDDASWNQVSKMGSLTEPVGYEMWRQFAEAHGKPVAFSEWGPDPNSRRDNPYYIKKMNDFFRQYGGTGAGNVWYDCVFTAEGYAYTFYPSGNVPNAVAMYRSLTWGK